MRRPLLLPLVVMAATAADACTTAADLDPARPVVAYNYDFPIGQGLVLVNKRGMSKVSGGEGHAARWQSRYGSVTFVQFGRDHPMAGMNEAGLVVSQMWLDEARYEAPDERPVLGVLEWVQHLLDTAATVEEALERSARVRIQSRIPLHYAVVDAAGRAAMIEFLDGQRVVHRGVSLPAPVLANSSYAASLAYLANLDPDRPVEGSGSLARFARAALRQRERPDGDPIGRAFQTLAAVAQPGHTRWSIVFDPVHLRVQWRSKENEALRSLDLRSFDLSCRAPVRLLDIHEGEGDVGPRFRDYSAEANEALVLSSYAQTTFLAPLGPEAARRAARVPEAGRCGE